LTPANVKSSTFGKLFSQPVDGNLIAQPLYVSRVKVNGAYHNLLLVATEHDSVYAFDADSNLGVNAAPLWKTSFINPAAGINTPFSGDLNTQDITPEKGITGTPVIKLGQTDSSGGNTGTLYVVAVTDENGSYFQRLHALDLTTGLDTVPPVVIAGDVVGTGSVGNLGTGAYLNADGKMHVAFNAMKEAQRSGLVLSGNVIYVTYASHSDQAPYFGWILSYDATTLQQISTYNDAPNSGFNGIWMSGAAPAVDSAGNLFFITGNGGFDANTGGLDYGDSFQRLSPTLTPMDYFTPSGQAQLSVQDLDEGSGGVMLLPDSVGSTAHPHLMVGCGKDATIYLVDRDNLGGFNLNSNNVVQQVGLNASPYGIWGSPAYWNGNIYYQGWNGPLKQYSIANGLLSTTQVSQSNDVSPYPGDTPSISANGATNGVVWTMVSSTSTLYAHDPTNVAVELYDSHQNAARDASSNGQKFAVPTVVNGKVYVGTQYNVNVFGLLAGQPVAVPIAMSSFETPSVGSGGFVLNPTGSGWTFTGASGIQSNGSTVSPAAALVVDPDGTQTAFLESYPSTTSGTMSESINFIATGTYNLRFLSAAASFGAVPVQLSVDGVPVGSPLTPASTFFNWLTSSPFTISTTGTHTITLAAATSGVQLVTLLDDVTVAPVTTVASPTVTGQSVSTAFNTPVSITLTGSDPNSPPLPLTYSITSAPAHGTLTGTAPNLTYTPAAGYSGTDSFQYSASNGVTVSFPATVSITVIGIGINNGSFETPSLGAGGFANNPTGASWTFTGSSGIQANGTTVTTPPNAPDGTQSAWIGNYQGVLGSISQSVNFPAAGIYSMSFQSANWINEGGPQPLQFSVDGINVGSPLSPLSTNFAPQTTASFGLSSAGNHTIALSATTNNGFDISFIDLVSLSQISTTPYKPTANSLSVSTAVGKSVSVTLSGADTNIPAAPLTYTITTGPAHGTLSGTAPNLTYTPATGYFGSDSFQYKVNNGTSDSAIATVSITVTATVSITNGSFETPSIAGTNGFAFTAASGWTFSGDSGIQANGNAVLNPAAAPDGTQTAFLECYPATPTGAISQSVTFPAAGKYTLSFQAAASVYGALPLQLSIDGVNIGSPLLPSSTAFGSLTSAPFTIGSAGVHTITLTGTISTGTLITLVDLVSITPISPILAPTANTQSIVTILNTAASVTLSGSDPNTPALPLTYSVTTSPSHGTLSGTAPNLTYTPTTSYYGSDSFQFKVSNGTLSSSIATVSITVNSTGIVNGSFETPSVGTASQQYNPVGATWTFLGDSGIQSNGSGWGVPNAPDGTQTAFLNGNPNRGTGNLGTISQNVNFPLTGFYVLNFQGARRQGQVQPLKLTVDGMQVGGLLTPSGSTFGLVTSGVFTISTTGLHTITLSATATTSDLTTMVDSVTLTPVTVATSSFVNGSFETPSVGTASQQYNPVGATWTFLGDSGIQSNGSGWGVPNAPDGTQTAFLNGNPNRGTGNLGNISQSVNFVATGYYVVSFQGARRQGQVQPLKLTVDGVQVGGLLTPSGSTFGLVTSGVFTISTTGLHTITLSATAITSDLTTMVDSVTLTPVTVATSSFANASFETPSVGTASQQYNPVGATWTFLGDSGIQSNGSGWGVPNAPDGTQTAFLNGNPNRGTGNLGNISQSVNFAATGNYTISFQGARRLGQVQPLMLTVDGVQVGGLLTPSGSTFGLVTSGVFTISTTGLHTITLSATAITSDLTTMVDQFSLNPQ